MTRTALLVDVEANERDCEPLGATNGAAQTVARASVLSAGLARYACQEKTDPQRYGQRSQLSQMLLHAFPSLSCPPEPAMHHAIAIPADGELWNPLRHLGLRTKFPVSLTAMM
jgi:hypothetical protein